MTRTFSGRITSPTERITVNTIPNQAPVPSTDITGWFQAAWSQEIPCGGVRVMHYFGEELIAWRDHDGKLTVMSAYCQHLGAHLGHGGTVTDDNCIQCPFHGWRWDSRGRNSLIPYQADRPNKTRRIATRPVMERNECVFIWNDPLGREPFYGIPDMFGGMFEDDATADDYYRGYPEGAMIRAEISVHPQWVMENGVDFAHFQYVHHAGSLPRLTAQEFRAYDAISIIEMTFGEGKAPTPLTPNGPVEGGVRTRSVGLGIGAALFWGADTMRTMVNVIPVDDKSATLRSTVWLPKMDKSDGSIVPERLRKRMDMANRQVERDLNIWSHQIYLDPPALASIESRGYRTLRNWSKRFYPVEHPGESARAEQEAQREADTRPPGQWMESVLKTA